MNITGILTRINPNGRIVIPAVIRKGMGVKLGETVVLSLEGGILRIQAQRAGSRATQDRLEDAEAETPALHKAKSEQTGDSASEADEWLG